MIRIQDDIDQLNKLGLLGKLLEDKSTNTNILWATDSYKRDYGPQYSFNKHITVTSLQSKTRTCVIKSRAEKENSYKSKRTKLHAEVFTPLEVVSNMVNYIDDNWFENENPFRETTLCSNLKAAFPSNQKWTDYIDSRRLEITCGEAPFLVQRYNSTTGELIPISQRDGILDRKLHVVTENTISEEDWLSWAIRSYQATYGYELQGDNVIIARINLLMTFKDYYEDKWKKAVAINELKTIINVIVWNIWQMDGLECTIPHSTQVKKEDQIELFITSDLANNYLLQNGRACRIKNWKLNTSVNFLSIKENPKKMKFDYIIGNPPYQEEQQSNDIDSSKKNYAPPVYHSFMDAAFAVGDKVELIHPARFLFNAGSTPKAWNEKMLNDPHFKILHYEPNSSSIFPNTDIKGGIAISYRDAEKEFGSTQVFSAYEELNSILKKVIDHPEYDSIIDIVFSRTSFRLTDKFHNDYPDAKNSLSDGHLYDISSNIFERIPFAFFDEEKDAPDFVKVLGRSDNQRVYKYIKSEYINKGHNRDNYKVFIPQAGGTGKFGEPIGTCELGYPNEAATETFLSMGCFNSLVESKNAIKYIKSKFFRTLLGILKVTQIGNRPVYRYIPLQDFSPKSDIDWSKSISEIDKQLYKKYNLSKEEIDFIETHVKEME